MKQLICLVLPCMALMAGCSIQVPVDVQLSGLESAVKMPAYTRAVVQIPEKTSSQVHTEQGLLAVGIAHNWNVEVGEAIKASVGPFFENYFTHVSVQEGYWRDLDCNDCGLIIRPSINSIKVSSVMMQAEITVGIKVYNAMGDLVLELIQTGKSSLLGADRIGVGLAGLWVPFFGDSMGRYVISTSVEDAFKDAYKQLAVDLEREMQSGALARVWLPKSLMNKAEYGRYEFAAERVARDKGCDLQSDRVKLLNKGFVELYDAFCWGQDVFQIECAYGRCRELQAGAGIAVVAN